MVTRIAIGLQAGSHCFRANAEIKNTNYTGIYIMEIHVNTIINSILITTYRASI